MGCWIRWQEKVTTSDGFACCLQSHLPPSIFVTAFCQEGWEQLLQHGAFMHDMHRRDTRG